MTTIQVLGHPLLPTSPLTVGPLCYLVDGYNKMLLTTSQEQAAAWIKDQLAAFDHFMRKAQSQQRRSPDQQLPRLWAISHFDREEYSYIRKLVDDRYA